jgi:meso-butanediol dehydrogenase / (S,S)-butanediol dehydrogenase / diacetyl reductase
MAGRLQDKVVVITGTGEGMARQVAMRLASEGALIIGCDVNAVTAQETLDAVRASGGQMESLHPLDLSEEERASSVGVRGGDIWRHRRAAQQRDAVASRPP